MYANLKKLRESLKMTQEEFGRSIGIAKSTYNNYETGIRKPKSNFWIAVATKYGVTIDYLMGYTDNPHLRHDEKNTPALSAEALDVAQSYHKLDSHGQKIINLIISEESARMNRDALTVVESEKLWKYYTPVSAGTGSVLDTQNGYEIIKTVSNAYTRKASFVVTVRGASMEPRFSDGDLILVQEDDDIEFGEVGIWFLDGLSYVKQKGHDKLISLNDGYRDVYMDEFSECRCQGRVIGVLDPDWILQ